MPEGSEARSGHRYGAKGPCPGSFEAGGLIRILLALAPALDMQRWGHLALIISHGRVHTMCADSHRLSQTPFSGVFGMFGTAVSGGRVMIWVPQGGGSQEDTTRTTSSTSHDFGDPLLNL